VESHRETAALITARRLVYQQSEEKKKNIHRKETNQPPAVSQL